jgi:hypothetical protein
MKTPPLPFTIGPIEELEKCFRDELITPINVLCDECFVGIKKATPQNYIAYWCGCYARIFNADNPQAATINSESWHTIREASVGHQANAAIIGIWTNPEGQFVCTYGVCQACAEHMKSLSEAARAEEADKITERLLRRYSFLQERLGVLQ